MRLPYIGCPGEGEQMSIPYGDDSIWRKEGGDMDERKEKVEAKLTSLSPVPS